MQHLKYNNVENIRGVFDVGEAGEFSLLLVLFLTLVCFETAKKVLVSPIRGVAVTHVFVVL